MKIYLYLSSQVRIFYLPQSVSGSFSFDFDDEETSKLINVNANNDSWYLTATDDCKIIDKGQYVESVVLEPSQFYVINRYNVNYLIFATDLEEDYNIFYYNNNFELSVGGDNATAVYSCPYINNLSFKVLSDNDKLFINVLSGNVYINKLLLKNNNYCFKNGDELSFYGVRIIFVNKMIFVFASENQLKINLGLSHLGQTNIEISPVKDDIDVKDKDLYSDDDYFTKSPRLRRIIEEKKIELTQPPQAHKSEDLPFLLTVGPMATMAVTSVVMLISPISEVVAGTKNIGDIIGQLVTAVTMLGSSLLWPIVTRAYNKRNKARSEKITKEKYQKYLEDKEKELLSEMNLQSEIIKENVISLDDCIDNLKHKRLNFWDKRVDQNDFLAARVGVGDEKLKVIIDEPKELFSAEEDELKEQVHELIEKYRYIKNVPIEYSFYENNITAIMGSSERCHDFVNNVLFQLLTFYSYEDLKVMVFTDNKNEHYWEYIKYLNHNTLNDNSLRFFASNEENAYMVIDFINQEINYRSQLQGQGPMQKPYYLIVIDSIDTIKKDNIAEKISELKENIGFSVIIIEKKLSKLPSLCNNFIMLNDGEGKSGILKNSYENQEQQLFTTEINSSINMMEVAKILSNIPIEIVSSDGDGGQLPDSITFLEMAKVGKVEQLNILNRWNTNDSTTNLKAEVGVDPNNKLMYLDLHEKAHGPHGLIAGMTGSGKSEFIITWILSLCMNFSPEDVAFILIDYKGGGLAFAFENQTTGVRLPHLAGTITNLDKAEIDRTLVSIDSEVKRRQKIFNEARDKLGESTIDIYKYQGFFHEGKLSEPLPHLFIVCDEFAELKSQQPDFMDNLISVARIGRSLGVHLILATQKPSGVVNDQIWSNTKFRVCLKVQDASDSNEMLKRPDAASLKQTGRFYLQVGYDEYFALGQSGWCGAKYYPSDIIQKSIDKSVNVIDETGVVLKSIQSGNSKQKNVEAQGEQLAAVLNEIIKVSKQSNKVVKRLWLENIPAIITIDGTEKKYNYSYEKGSFKFIIGEYDAPEKQQQYPLTYDLLNDGNANFISTDSQETEEIISTLLYSIVRNCDPTEVSYYIIDYGSQGFLKHKNSPNCGGVVSPGDTEEYANLLKLIITEQKSRKKILSDFGGEYKDYVSKNPGKMPLMLIILNNYESMNESINSFYDELGGLLRDSERYGIIYIITSGGVGSLPDRFKNYLPFSLVFKVKDPHDYSYCFGSRDKKQPKDLFCRGVCFNDTLHEFQTAFISEERINSNKKILEGFEEARSRSTNTALKIPSLPDQVTFDYIKDKIKGLNKMPIGVEKETLSIKYFDLATSIAKTVLGPKLKYVQFFIKSFIKEILDIKNNVIVIDAAKSLVDIKSTIKNYFDDNLDERIDKIIEFISNTNADNNVIVINSISKLLENLGTSDKVSKLFECCKKSGKAHILIADEVLKIRDFTYDDWFKSVDLSEGLYIGPGVSDQTVLKISNYAKELSDKYPNNYGFYIYEGSYAILKVIEFEKIKESDDDNEE